MFQARAIQLELQSRWQDVLAVSVECLQSVGFDLPQTPTLEQVNAAVQQVTQLFPAKQSRIAQFPPAVGRVATALNIYSRLLPTAFHAHQLLYPLLTARIAGMCLASECIVPSLGMALLGVANSLLAADVFELGMEISRYAHFFADNSESPFWRCKTYNSLIGFNKWLDTRYSDLVPLQEEARKLGMVSKVLILRFSRVIKTHSSITQEAGDTVHVAFNVFIGALLRYFSGMSLSMLSAHCESVGKWFRQQNASISLKRYVDVMLDGFSALTLNGRPLLVRTYFSSSIFFFFFFFSEINACLSTRRSEHF